MALPLNVFKTVTNVVSTSNVGIYTAPVGYAGVVILAQCANTSSDTTHSVTFTHRRSGTDTEIVKDFPVPPRDTVSFLGWKTWIRKWRYSRYFRWQCY